jgi:anti-sigma factor RsiW
MNCQSSRELLQEYLDGESIDAAELEAHLATCVECRRLHAAGRTLLFGLSLAPVPAPSAELTARIVQRVQRDRQARRRRRLLTTFALAASLLLAFGVIALGPTPKVRIETPEHARHVAPSPSTPELRDSVAQAGSAVVALTTRTAEEVVDPARELLPALAGPMFGDLDWNPMLDPPAVVLGDAGQGLKASLEPFTSSARRAVGLFLRDLSPGEAEAQPGL